MSEQVRFSPSMDGHQQLGSLNAALGYVDEVYNVKFVDMTVTAKCVCHPRGVDDVIGFLHCQ
jgi:hypothetical protein